MLEDAPPAEGADPEAEAVPAVAHGHLLRRHLGPRLDRERPGTPEQVLRELEQLRDARPEPASAAPRPRIREPIPSRERRSVQAERLEDPRREGRLERRARHASSHG